MLSVLDEYWVNKRDATLGYCRSRVLADDLPSPKVPDIAVIPSAIHSLGTEATYGPADPRMQATLARLAAQISAKHLAWSHAAFISCVSARRIAATACEAPRRR